VRVLSRSCSPVLRRRVQSTPWRRLM